MSGIEEIERNYDESLGYVVARFSDKTGFAFLVDRNRIKNKWWSGRLGDAMGFISKIAAEKQADKLKYGNVFVESRTFFQKGE